MINSVALALDLGTTTLAGRLLNGAGTVLAEARQLNPQREVGADVIRRLEAALQGEGARLRRLLVKGIDALCCDLMESAGIRREMLNAVAVAANPAITTLLCGDDPRPLLFPPYRPRQCARRELDATSLGLDFPVPLSIFPLVSGHVGGDLVAFLYGLGPVAAGTLAIDLGTNGEIALFVNDGWLATSVAAGPAFEGGGIAYGMLAGPGAISAVTRDGDRLQLEVIGNGPPRGLAGSGLFTAIATGLDEGLIDPSGRIVAPDEVDSSLARYLVSGDDGYGIRLYRDAYGEVCITQQDVRAFQLAKGAVRAGIDVLLARAQLSPGAVVQVFVTGAFGLSLKPHALKTVAILPSDMVKRTFFVSNGALRGVSNSLLAADGPSAVASLARSIKSAPLSGTPMFERAFLAALNF